jgi:transposase-like protein
MMPHLHTADGKAGELCRQHGISETTLHNWKANPLMTRPTAFPHTLL